MVNRAQAGRIGAHALHAKVSDPIAHTAPARKAFLDRFERQVDPDGILEPAERARRAAHAKKAYFLSLSLKSARSRAASSAEKKASRQRAHLEALALRAEIVGDGPASSVYRLFAADGSLLYVGKTSRGLLRVHEHATSAAWWTQVAYQTFEHFETESQALAAEEHAIRSEHPLHNTRHAQP